MKIGAPSTVQGPQHTRPLPLRQLGTLTTTKPAHPGQPAFLSSGSGLVKTGGKLFVVADDELSLGVFPPDGKGKGSWMKLVGGSLPLEEKARKAQKPDLESLTLLAPMAGAPHGALLAVGSGSSKTGTRNGAVMVGLNEEGLPRGKVTRLDLSAVYAQLGTRFGVNIEGCVALGNTLRLLQRGNGEGGKNAFVDLDLRALQQAARDKTAVPASAILKVIPQQLGTLDGVPLSFTDACALPDGRMVFSAAAEDSANSYDDGKNAGSVVGVADQAGKILFTQRLDTAFKIEGVHATQTPRGLHLLLVADPDDRKLAAPLFETTLPL